MTRSGFDFAGRTGPLLSRIARAWRGLPSERRLAALAAAGLFLTLFLPWYQETVIATSAKASHLQSASETLTGWGAFSWVEAAVLVVSLGVLFLLFQRAEGRAFHLPGGDGWVVTAAGAWTCFLVIWRMFDKQGTTSHGLYASTAGIEWGIFVALLVAAILAYAGTRISAAHQPEPPLSDGVVFDGRWQDPSAAADHRAQKEPGAATARASRRQGRASTSAAAEAPGRPKRREAPGGAAGSETEPAFGAATADAPRRPQRRRSSWSPGERPDWSEPARPEGWLTAPPSHQRDDQSPPEDATAPPADHLSPPSDATAPLADHVPPPVGPARPAGPGGARAGWADKASDPQDGPDDDQLTMRF